MINTLFVFGTRPEAIKLAPVINRLKSNEAFSIKICVTSQHREMLDQVLDLFGIVPDYDLSVMRDSQDLFDITTKTLGGLRDILNAWKHQNREADEQVMIVQGDTTSTLSAALAAFYSRVKVAHVEAGLRSFDKFRPYPEEVNRRVTSIIADIHFAPTELSRKNLLRDGVEDSMIFVTGNTVVDALRDIVVLTKDYKPDCLGPLAIDFSKRIVLVTAHRRENFGKSLNEICSSLIKIASKYKDTVEIIYPVHMNPNVSKIVTERLKSVKNIHLIPPLPYDVFVWLMSRSFFVLTDSGGLQEEAPSLGKPVLIMRDTTERPEGISAGTARLVGTTMNNIVENAGMLLDKSGEYEQMARATNPYGDGKSCERIESILLKVLTGSSDAAPQVNGD